MSALLVFAEFSGSQVKKSTLEAVSLARKMAQASGRQVVSLVLGSNDQALATALAGEGADKVLMDGRADFQQADSAALAHAIQQAANQVSATTIVFSNTYAGKSIAPRVAARLNASIASGVVDLPIASGSGWTVKKSVYSGKGFASVQLNGSHQVIAITPNSYQLNHEVGAGEVIASSFELTTSLTKSVEVNKVTGKIPLTEAEIVVSGGRGWKGPENWGMIEELASLLGAATACSKPVSDMHWRPHEEHVGQTGITIKPNLYIATGISGAIQHLAGVSSSKVIVAINKDPEAPFFKVADYGIVGDVFEVMPQIIQAAKDWKASKA